MSNTEKNENFFKPVLSTLGFVFTFIATILPVLTKEPIQKYFVNKDYLYPSSLVSLLFGIIIAWSVFEFYNYPEIKIGRLKDRGNGYLEPKIRISTSKIIWLSILLDSAFFVIFFSISKETKQFLQIFQSLVYIMFFGILIFIFSTLVSITKVKFDNAQEREKLVDNIYSTLEKNKHINTGIVIYENRMIIDNEEKKDLGVANTPGFVRKVRVETSGQSQKYILAVLSSDGKELLNTIKSQEIS